MIVVSDTSALSNLALVEHLWLLEAIYQTVIIPDIVASELAAASSFPGKSRFRSHQMYFGFR
jgi:predicted nucleic acid-binding protein